MYSFSLYVQELSLQGIGLARRRCEYVSGLPLTPAHLAVGERNPYNSVSGSSRSRQARSHCRVIAG